MGKKSGLGGLVLGRREGESIEIDGPATIYIEKIEGNRVAVRIIAPKATKVIRGELKSVRLLEGDDAKASC